MRCYSMVLCGGLQGLCGGLLCSAVGDGAWQWVWDQYACMPFPLLFLTWCGNLVVLLNLSELVWEMKTATGYLSPGHCKD